MYLIYLFVALAIVFTFLAYRLEESWDMEMLFDASTIASGISWVVLLIMIVAIPINRMNIKAHIQRHEELRAMNNAMAVGYAMQKEYRTMVAPGELQTVSWKQTIAGTNTALAEAKYYAANPWTSVWYPRAVSSVEPIR